MIEQVLLSLHCIFALCDHDSSFEDYYYNLYVFRIFGLAASGETCNRHARQHIIELDTKYIRHELKVIYYPKH
jgi:hypothetical protein